MCLVPLRPSPNLANQAPTGHIEAPQPAKGSQMPETSASPQETTFLGRRLIFFGAAENKTEPALLQLFSKHGEVADMFIVRSALGISSGCGHVTFAAAQQARAALEALKGTTDCAEPGSSLGLLLVEEGPSTASTCSSTTGAAAGAPAGAPAGDDAASTVSSSSKGDAQQGSSSAAPNPTQDARMSKTVFFTKVPPTVTQQQLQQLFSACGTVAHLELFIPWPGAKISRGCGLVEFASSSSAAAAVHSLHQAFTWPHSHSALVVEWADRNRQNTNNKAKQARAANSSGMGGSPGDMPPGMSLRTAEQLQGAAMGGYGWRPAHGKGYGFAGAHSLPQAQLLQLQQQAVGGSSRSSHSCPLPQLPPGWQVIGTAQQLPPAAGRMARPDGSTGAQWAAVPGSHSTMAQGPRAQQQAGTAAAPFLQQGVSAAADALVMQQQQQMLLQQQRGGVATAADTGSTGTWVACPVTTAISNTSMEFNNSMASLGSVYDPALLSSSTFSSAANSAANSGVLQPHYAAGGWDAKKQQGKVLDLTDLVTSAGVPSSASVATVMGQPYSEPMLSAAATAAAMAGNSNDAILQQLLQQNVMLFQTMTPPPEEEALPQHMLMTSSAGQQQGLQATNMLASPGTGMTYVPLSQAPQLAGTPALYTSSGMQSPAQRQQQLWFLQQGQAQLQQQQQPQQAAQQQQQQQGEGSAVVALPLSQRQLAGMAGVLPEVPKLTGAQAWISSAATGGLQLCLSGTLSQLQAGHTAVAMLLGKLGIDEPLAPAVVHAAAT